MKNYYLTIINNKASDYNKSRINISLTAHQYGLLLSQFEANFPGLEVETCKPLDDKGKSYLKYTSFDNQSGIIFTLEEHKY